MLPLHETVETFLAGVIFAVASNFILIGSTKIVTVIFTYGDVFFGFPLRVVGGAGWRTLEERAQPPPAEPTEPPKQGVWAVLDFFQPKPKPDPPTLEAIVRANKARLLPPGLHPLPPPAGLPRARRPQSRAPPPAFLRPPPFAL